MKGKTLKDLSSMNRTVRVDIWLHSALEEMALHSSSATPQGDNESLQPCG